MDQEGKGGDFTAAAAQILLIVAKIAGLGLRNLVELNSPY